ncbi:MAG: ATP-binding cassette domain-containing protein, partial [Candidatus Rokuibacteriota bacterium]
MLELDRLNVFRGSAQVLRNLSLLVAEREAVCLVGRNGAGKTTTIDSIMGLLPVRSGRVTFGTRDIIRLPTHRRALAGIGYS